MIIGFFPGRRQGENLDRPRGSEGADGIRALGLGETSHRSGEQGAERRCCHEELAYCRHVLISINVT